MECNGNVDRWYLCKHIRLSNIIFHKHCFSFEHIVWPPYSLHLTFPNGRKLKRIFGSLVLTDQLSDNFTRGSNNAGPDNAFVLFLCTTKIWVTLISTHRNKVAVGRFVLSRVAEAFSFACFDSARSTYLETVCVHTSVTQIFIVPVGRELISPKYWDVEPPVSPIMSS